MSFAFLGLIALVALAMVFVALAVNFLKGGYDIGMVILLIAVLLAIAGFIIADSLRNIELREPGDVKAGNYKIACEDSGRILLTYRSWDNEKDSRVAFVPKEAFGKIDPPPPPCRDVAIWNTKNPDGSVSLEAK